MKNINIIQRTVLFVILFAIMAALPSITFAGAAGFFSRVEGNVDILREGAKTPALVSKGDTVSTGDVIRTKIDSRAEIIFKDETLVRLAPETRIKIDEYLDISLLRGKVKAVVSTTFNIQTPTAVAGVRDTTIFVFYQFGATGVIFKGGSGLVSNPNDCAPSRAVNVNDGQISFVSGECAPPSAARDVTGAELSRHTTDTAFTEDAGGVETRRGEDGKLYIAPPGSGGGGGIFGYTAPTSDIAELNRKLAGRVIDTGNVGLSISETNPGKLRGPRDNTPPVVTINSAPPAVTNLGTASFTHTANENAAVSFELDGLSVDTASFNGLSEGSHTFTVHAVDSAGNASSKSYTWTTDYTPPPAASFTGTLPVPVSDSAIAAFSFTSDDPISSFSYRLDGGSWKSSGDSVSLSGATDFGEGLHTIDLITTDPAGNKSTERSHSWFYGRRHYTMTGLVIGSGSRLEGDAILDLYAMSTGNRGGWTADLSGTYSGPSGDSWQMLFGGNSSDALGAWRGYWLNNASGTYSGNLMSGTSSLNYLAETTLGTGNGVINGAYDSESGEFMATDLGFGTYTESPLSFMSNVFINRTARTTNHDGRSFYADGGYYVYEYYDNNTYGYQSYYRPGPGGEFYDTYYFSDGTTYTWDYNTVTETYGTWDPATLDLSTLTNPPDPGIAYTDSNSEVTTSDVGYLFGILGGTSSLWSGNAIPVSVIGESILYTSQPHIWYGDLSSYNHNNSTDTTYDGGAYYGFMAGIDTGNNNGIEGRIYALYVDPDGHSGYLKGDLNGSSYPEINMFEMEGNIDRTQVVEDAGVTAGDLYDSIWKGSITGSVDHLETYSIVGYQSGESQHWGIFYQEIGGQFSTPAADWTAKMGGSGDFGVINPYMQFDGEYNYSDGGYYGYGYCTNNACGHKYYYRPGGEFYDTYYNSDGTTDTFDNNTDTLTPGTWDPATFDLSSLSTPPDPDNATLDSSSIYSRYEDTEKGYWLANVSGGTWDGEKIIGTINGRYMTPYRIGDITGEVLGTYDTSGGTWQAMGMGTYTGTTPLAFSDSFSDYYHYIDTDYYWLNPSYLNPIKGILGTTVSPFLNPGTPVALHLMGEGYPDYVNNRTLWWAGISGNNYVDTSSQWAGWLGGYTSPDNIVRGVMNGLYVDSSGHAGILLSNHFTGTHYSDALNVWEAEGNLTAIEMATYYSAGSLSYIKSYPDSYLAGNLLGGFGTPQWDIYSDGGYLQDQNGLGYDISQTRRFAGESWGIYQLGFGGGFNNKPEGTSAFTMGIDEGNNWFSLSDIWGSYTTGTWNENNTIEGKTYGYVADTSTPLPTTWISVGDTLGTFDPVASTWQAVQMGVFLETNRFLSMTHTTEGQAQLSQLNIPYAEVGRATLTGRGNNFEDLTMTDTVFFAYNSGEAPKIWATGNVSGSYTADPVLNIAVPLAGGGLTAGFTPRSWDTGNGQWRSEIAGSGGFNGSTSFQGAGAGTINTGDSSISGTAAGIAK